MQDDTTTPSDAGEVEALRKELADAKTEIANLQLQLASKTAEADSLKEELEQLQRDVAGEDDDQRHADTPGSLSKMQERLTRLRKEQADAEAERQAAWSELKKVVNDISSLASVDYLQSVNIPKGP